MGLRKTENQVQVLLKDTILALCRNTLNYRAEICIEGLLCITMDSEEVLLVNINQVIKNQELPKRVKKKRKKVMGEVSSDEGEMYDSVSPKAKRKKSSEEHAAVVTLFNEQCNERSRNKDINTSCTEEEEDMATSQENNTNDDIENSDCDSSILGVVMKEEPADVIVVKEELNELPPCDNAANYMSSNLLYSPRTFSSKHLQDPEHHNQQDYGHLSEDSLLYLDQHDRRGAFTIATATPSTSSPTTHMCLLCGKSFAHMWLLKRHQVVHSGDKDYSCKHCRRTYSYQSSLKRHQDSCVARLGHLQDCPPGGSCLPLTPGGMTAGHVTYVQNENEHSTSLKPHSNQMNPINVHDGVELIE